MDDTSSDTQVLVRSQRTVHLKTLVNSAVFYVKTKTAQLPMSLHSMRSYPIQVTKKKIKTPQTPLIASIILLTPRVWKASKASLCLDMPHWPRQMICARNPKKSHRILSSFQCTWHYYSHNTAFLFRFKIIPYPVCTMF